MDDVRLETLHDHYKETFQYIRERERLRDRLFLILIALYALLAVQIQYPRQFDGTIETINLLGLKVDVSSLPLPAFLSGTWVFVLAVVLRYCQTTINVERQYDYLHKIEDTLSPEFGNDLYRREGKEYIDNYPAFSNWSWRFYTVVLPAIVILATVMLAWEEFWGLGYPVFNKLLDLGLAIYIILLFLLYRILPLLVNVGGWLLKSFRNQSNSDWPAPRELIQLL